MKNEIVLKTLMGYFLEHNIHRADVADSIGVSRAHFYSIMKGRYTLTKSVAVKLSKRYGFSEEWLTTGEGNVFSSDNDNNYEPDISSLINKIKQQEYEIKELKKSLEKYTNELMELYKKYGLTASKVN
ncbi:MAG: helix-turn-helix transcriptional regulator [Prevotella sp.]|nr:helix-turn-helix transcriptional regulator [Candidatus Prevotella equi]